MAKAIHFRFPDCRELGQTGVSPMGESKRRPTDLIGIWGNNSQRFQTRAKGSGYLNAQLLWDEAMTQVDKGWLGQPVPLDELGHCDSVELPGPVVAFRFGVDQLDKVRSRDDLKYPTANEYCTVWTPIKLPTWDHIGQMALLVKDTLRPWSFLKADLEAAYKQLPIDPDQATLAMVGLRRPTLGTWRGFLSHTLLFGAESAATHYNCFSGILAVFVNRVFGISLISYFDDMGSMTPSELAHPALTTLKEFLPLLLVFLNPKKTAIGGGDVIFLGLLGLFPNPRRDMTLSIILPGGKKTKWVAAIKATLGEGAVSRDLLDPLVGRLSFPQTSLFGRFGRPMMTPLHTKANTLHYKPTLSEREIRTLQWRASALSNLGARTIRDSAERPGAVVFTDAETSTAIIAAVAIIRKDFLLNGAISEVRKTATGKYWETFFVTANLIYGLEMLALLALLYRPNCILQGKNATFHIDNGNAFEAVVKNNAKPTIIVAMTHLIWHRIRQLNITAWFEWVPGTRNIADLPTRKVDLPFPVKVETDNGGAKTP